LERSARERAIGLVGAAVGATLVLMKLLPNVPGHFTVYEYIALGLWALLGLALKRKESSAGFVNQNT
jgi:hypothetical protein